MPRYHKTRVDFTSIPQTVKRHVYERDKGCCVLCGSPYGEPNAHYISRAQGGLGIERNIVTLCRACHYRYDQTTARKQILSDLRAYLHSKYPNWNENELTYRKNGGKNERF